MANSKDIPVPPGYRLICRQFVTNRYTGKKIFRPDGKPFCFLVRDDKDE